jgi:4'-phosphopantetheinyl transferase
MPWRSRSKASPITADDLHLWCCDLSSQRLFDLQHLSADEQARAQRLRDPSKRDQFIRSRSFLRQILATYLDSSPACVKLVYGERGKPQLDPVHKTSIQFNLAHSAGLAVILLAQEAVVGIDLERVDSQLDFLQIAQHYFVAADYQRLQMTAEVRRRRHFYRAWTRSEALVKLTGAGIGGARQGCAPAFVRSLSVASGYVCSLATEIIPRRIARFHFNDL